ncbi:serine protease [Bdellovibrio bacteriovorus]|uniref:trypsin-like serine peptidase n=1 Tax=Bdellovibrio bacteriovorus TaxID=959 RepID=UPI0035A6ADC2
MRFLLCALLPLGLAACTGSTPEALSKIEAPGAIYNGDTREDVSTSSSPEKELVKATAVLVHSYRLVPAQNPVVKLNSTPLEQLYPLCPNEKFLTQPTLGFCSGTLIAPNLVLTAGHCVETKKTATTVISYSAGPKKNPVKPCCRLRKFTTAKAL